MKIMLGGKYSGKRIIEAFSNSIPSLIVLAYIAQRYERIITAEKAMAIKISPTVKIVWRKDVKLVPYKLIRRKKYFLFGSIVEKWKEDFERLWVKLHGIIEDDEYEEIKISFETGISFGDDESGFTEIVPIDPNCHPDEFEKFRYAIEAFLRKFKENL